MNSSRCLNLALLTMLFAGTAVVFAQQPDERPQEPKQEEPKQEESRPAESKPPESKPSTSKPAQAQDQQKTQQKEEKQEQKQEQKQQKAQEKQGNPNQMAPAQQQQSHMAAPSGKSAHIPDNTFHQNFGRQHTFVVNQPVIVAGRPQIVYGGYTFVFIDPWPVEWAYTDNCYIDYIDGEYFLFDLLHPGIRIALFVSL
jgi:hypothetical protein